MIEFLIQRPFNTIKLDLHSFSKVPCFSILCDIILDVIKLIVFVTYIIKGRGKMIAIENISLLYYWWQCLLFLFSLSKQKM